MKNECAAAEATRSPVRASLGRYGDEQTAVARTRQQPNPVPVQVAARKEFLPRRSGEPRFAPQQYVYSASRSGAVPTGQTPQAA